MLFQLKPVLSSIQRLCLHILLFLSVSDRYFHEPTTFLLISLVLKVWSLSRCIFSDFGLVSGIGAFQKLDDIRYIYLCLYGEYINHVIVQNVAISPCLK